MAMIGWWSTLLIALTLSSCSPALQSEVIGLIEPVAKTAIKEGGDLAQTEGANLQKTAEAAAKTQISSIKQTDLPGLVTDVVEKLTPQPPSTAQPPKSNDVVTYTVKQGDTLSKIASVYSLELNDLITLNQDRYPSLVQNPDHVEIGWVLIVSTGSGKSISPPPSPAPSTIAFPTTCDQTSVYWTDNFSCEPYRLDAVTEIGLSIGCVVFDDNPLGYFKTHTIYDGWVITRNGYIFSYGWFIDKDKNQVVIGPAIVEKTTKYVECGIPGNP